MTAPDGGSSGASAGWEHFDHGADIGVRGYGPRLADAFAQAAIGLTAIVTDPAAVVPAVSLAVDCSEADPELLFVDWLNRIIYEMAVRRMLFSHFDVTLRDGRLQAEICGEAVDRSRHDPAVEVKGATFTELAVRQRNDGIWVAQCVIDV